MSHVAILTTTSFKDIEAIKKAAKRLGLVFSEKKTYRWFGRYVGDYPLPEGFKREDLGKCDYCLSIPNNNRAYEVGIVNKDGRYYLLWDFWAGGKGLQNFISYDDNKGGKLIDTINIESFKIEASKKGLTYIESKDNNGRPQLQIKIDFSKNIIAKSNDGEINIEANGFAGQGCKDITKSFEKAVNSTLKERKIKTDSYMIPKIQKKTVRR